MKHSLCRMPIFQPPKAVVIGDWIGLDRRARFSSHRMIRIGKLSNKCAEPLMHISASRLCI